MLPPAHQQVSSLQVDALQTPPRLSDARAPRRVDGLGDGLGDPLGDSQGISYQNDVKLQMCGARLSWTSLYVSDTSVGAWYVALLSILSNKAARGWLINHRILRPGAQHWTPNLCHKSLSQPRCSDTRCGKRKGVEGRYLLCDEAYAWANERAAARRNPTHDKVTVRNSPLFLLSWLQKEQIHVLQRCEKGRRYVDIFFPSQPSGCHIILTTAVNRLSSHDQRMINTPFFTRGSVHCFVHARREVRAAKEIRFVWRMKLRAPTAALELSHTYVACA